MLQSTHEIEKEVRRSPYIMRPNRDHSHGLNNVCIFKQVDYRYNYDHDSIR